MRFFTAKRAKGAKKLLRFFFAVFAGLAVGRQ